MTDEQSSQPLTDAELVAIRTRFDNRNGDMRSWGPVTLFHAAREVPRLLAEVDRLRAENDRLRKQVQDYHESADVHVAKFDRQHERLMEAESEVERLNLEVVQVQSGAQIAMNAGVAALQEVGRLEKKRDQLKEINDRMAEDRLRLTAIVEAQRVALSTRGAPVPECPDEWCPGWKDSGICPADLKHW